MPGTRLTYTLPLMMRHVIIESSPSIADIDHFDGIYHVVAFPPNKSTIYDERESQDKHHSLTDELVNHDQTYTDQKEILSGIQIEPWQRFTPFLFGDNWPIIQQCPFFPT